MSNSIKPNILFYTKDKQGCGFYRMLMPANEIKKQDLANIEVIFDPFNKQAFDWANLIIMQRPTSYEMAELIQYNRANGKKVIYEIDDYMQGILPGNPGSPFWEHIGGNVSRAMNCMRLCNTVTVSTPKLQREYSFYNPHIHCLPNYIDESLWDNAIKNKNFYNKRKNDNIIRIGWEGCVGHRQDLALIAKVIEDIITEYKGKVHFVMFGFNPLDIFMKLPNLHQKCPECSHSGPLEYYPLVPLLEYPTRLKELAFDIGIAPTVRISFNDCKCVVGDTLVNTENGLEFIKNIIKHRENNKQKISENVGYVINSEKDLINAHFYAKNEDTIKITTKEGYSIEGTYTHRIQKENKEWVSLKELNIGDSLKLNKIKFSKNFVKIPFNFWATLSRMYFDEGVEDLPKFVLTEKYAEIIGTIIGDGHFSGGTISIACDLQDLDIIDYYTKLCISLGFSVRQWDEKKANCRYVGFSSMAFKKILIKIGVGTEQGKKIFKVPESIFKSPKKVISKFIRGLFDSDGTVGKTGVSFISKSKELVQGVQLLLLGFNIKSRIGAGYSKQYNKYYYTLYIRRIATEIFAEEIGFKGQRKANKLKCNLNKKRGNNILNNTLIDTVEKIELFKDKEVFDITVKNNACYVGNGFLSHNSDLRFKEYSYLGIPTIASDVPAYNESIKHEKTGFLCSDSYKDWYKHLKLLIDDAKKRKEIGQNAKIWANTKTISNNITKWLDVYSKTLNRVD